MVQPELLVDPVHTLVVPRPTIQTKAMEALPETPARALLGDRLQSIDNLAVTHQAILTTAVPSRP